VANPVIFPAQLILAVGRADARRLIRENLVNSDQWLIRGILAIYRNQTAGEQTSESTIDDNKIGFNGVDAGIMTSFAKQILAWQSQTNPRHNTPLSEKQIASARKIMLKYSGQLAKIARNEIEHVDTK
jgi:hypothetical protein